MKKAEIIERINAIDLDMLNAAVHCIMSHNPINEISVNKTIINSNGNYITRLDFTSRATKANMLNVYYAILDEIICRYGIETAQAIDPDYIPAWYAEMVLEETEKAEARAQVLISELKETITETADQTSQDTATFANALAEYAAIVKAVKEDYNGKATVSIIREEHPELDFMDDNQIQEIIDQGNK